MRLSTLESYCSRNDGQKSNRKGVMISSGCTISRAARLDIGKIWIKENVEIGGFVIIGNVIIGCRTRIDGKGRVLIGSNTHIGRDVDIYSHRHILDDPETMVNNSKKSWNDKCWDKCDGL